MPYPYVRPVIVEPEYEEDVPQVISHPDMPTDLEELQRSWVQLKEERDTFEAQFRAKEKKVLELTKQLQEAEYQHIPRGKATASMGDLKTLFSFLCFYFAISVFFLVKPKNGKQFYVFLTLLMRVFFLLV